MDSNRRSSAFFVNRTARRVKGKSVVMFSRNIGPALVTRLRRTCLAVDFDKEAFDGAAALAAVQTRMRKAYETEHAAFMAQHGNDEEPAEASS